MESLKDKILREEEEARKEIEKVEKEEVRSKESIKKKGKKVK